MVADRPPSSGRAPRRRIVQTSRQNIDRDHPSEETVSRGLPAHLGRVDPDLDLDRNAIERDLAVTALPSRVEIRLPKKRQHRRVEDGWCF